MEEPPRPTSHSRQYQHLNYNIYHKIYKKKKSLNRKSDVKIKRKIILILNKNFMSRRGMTFQLIVEKPTPSYVEVVALSGKLRVPISTDLRELR